MNRLWRSVSVILLLIVSVTLEAKQLQVNALRYSTGSDHARMVFDVSGPASHKVFVLNNPDRLVIDFNGTKLLKSLIQPPANHPLFSRVRSGTRNKKNLRVVFDLKRSVSSKSFTLKPDKKYGHRLVVDSFPKGSLAGQKTLKKHVKAKKVANKVAKKTAVKSVMNKARDIVVAIDAGHGGVDPGAHGPKGTQEKKVVFQIAKKVAALINRKPGMKAVMVRKGDYFIKLRKRMQIARAAGADLFVSIHADAFENSNVKGASVFTLSERGATGEAARWLSLAKRENSADLVGGLKLADKEDMVASVLMDLSQTATKEASRQVAGKVLKNFKSIGHLHQNRVQKAGFMVLKSPDIPSILVETAFISNPNEERKLRSSVHQKKIAKAIYRGIVSYFKQYPPADTYFAQKAQKRHVISRGETLSGIAQQYGVSMASIKSVNALVNNRIKIGQVLTIPKG